MFTKCFKYVHKMALICLHNDWNKHVYKCLKHVQSLNHVKRHMKLILDVIFSHCLMKCIQKQSNPKFGQQFPGQLLGKLEKILYFEFTNPSLIHAFNLLITLSLFNWIPFIVIILVFDMIEQYKNVYKRRQQNQEILVKNCPKYINK